METGLGRRYDWDPSEIVIIKILRMDAESKGSSTRVKRYEFRYPQNEISAVCYRKYKYYNSIRL